MRSIQWKLFVPVIAVFSYHHSRYYMADDGYDSGEDRG
jgi:hypothetical protein